MPRIVNLTQHQASAEQIEAGVFETADRTAVDRLLTFDVCPSMADIRERAGTLAKIARGAGAEAAMVGGASYLMAPLERALRLANIKPLYAFSKRESLETRLPDGSVRKTQIFKHEGWVDASDVGTAT